MALNFPDSPSVNDIFVSGTSRWIWNGTSWVRQGTPGTQGAQGVQGAVGAQGNHCLLYTSPSPRDRTRSRMPSSA